MLAAINADHAAETGRKLREGRSVITDYLGAQGSEEQGPQAFLVETLPNRRIEPHFHPIDQFQLFVGGTGRLGKKPVATGALQYADQFTPYGPIVDEGGDGIAFFTLRPISSAATHFMPGSRELMENRAGRNLLGLVDLAVPAEVRSRRLFVEDDGVSAFELAAPAGVRVPRPDAPSHGGAYIIVLAGAAIHDSKTYGPRSCFWFEGDDAAPELKAGPDGVVAAFMSFPRTTAEHHAH